MEELFTELFDIDSVEQYRNENIIDLNNIIVNPYLSNDVETLQKYYTILLDYVCDLEEKLKILKYENMKIKRKLFWINKNEEVIHYEKKSI